MFTTSTTRGSAAKPEGPSWQPLSSVDFMLLGFVSIFQLQALVICFHLIWCRKWPPYVTKNVILVVISVSYHGPHWAWLRSAVQCLLVFLIALREARERLIHCWRGPAIGYRDNTAAAAFVRCVCNLFLCCSRSLVSKDSPHVVPP